MIISEQPLFGFIQKVRHYLTLFVGLVLVSACVSDGEFYDLDPTELEKIETKIQVSSFESPTLGDPKIAMSDHEAFIDSYYNGNQRVMASAMHRLADLYMIMESKGYEKELRLYSQRLRLYRQGRLTRAPLPPVPPYRQSVRLYEKILVFNPDRPENDRVLYQLARVYEAQDRSEKRTEMLQRLVVDYPDSFYVPEVQFRLAEVYFEAGMFREAAAAYMATARGMDFSVFERAKKGSRRRAEMALAEAHRREEEERALYKAGWTQMAMDDYDGALKTFQGLLDRKEELLEIRPYKFDPTIVNRGEWDFLQEVLRGLSITLSNWVSPEKVNDYFEEIGHKKYEYLIYEKIGKLHLARKRHYDAVRVFQGFLDRYPMHPNSPMMAMGIVAAYQRLNLVDPANKARKTFLEHYGTKSRWFRDAPYAERQKVKPELKKMVYQLAIFYHSEAQQTKRRKVYEQSIHWYQQFLEKYPTEPEAARVNFLMAEGLYEMGKFEAAAVEYEKTAYDYDLHADSAEAGFAGVLARERLMSRVDKSKNKEKFRAVSIRLGESSSRFTTIFPSDERALKVQLRGAQVFFGVRVFKEARRMAEEVAITYGPMKDPAVEKAQLLIGNSHYEERSFEKAVEVYRRIDLVRVNEKDRKKIRKLWATALYKVAEGLRESGRLEEAEEAFYHVQRELPQSAVAPVALYDAGLLAMGQEDYNGALASFALLTNEYPDNEFSGKVPRLLLQTEQKLLDKSRYADAKILADGLKHKGLNVHSATIYQAQALIANRYFEEKSYNKAVQVYRELNTTEISEGERVEVQRLWASALYKEAEGLRKKGEFEEAERAFRKVHEEVPTSEIAPVALYDAGLIAMKQKNLDRAIRSFRKVSIQYPTVSHAVHATVQLARIHEEQGKLREAAVEYERIPKLTEDRKLSADSTLSAAILYEKLEDWPKTQNAYREYIDTNTGEFEKIVNINFKLIEIKRRLGDDGGARVLLKEFVEHYDSLRNDEPTLGYFLARARIISAGYLHEEYKAIQLVDPLAENLNKKKQFLAEVLELYISATEYQVGDVVTEAAHQIGQVFEEFRTALLESERPTGLTPQQLDQYDFLLEEQAYPFEEKAISAFETNVKRAQQLGLYDDWIKESYANLSRLNPGRYQKPEFEEIVIKELVFLK